ncbi:prolyl endopeptidase isoform X1 [Arctopsyche grandis]|uniref:prolyl endopeptidase isoform X1 n=1 Tax=Arctopsyche grandis TaxID=121162 RepID=UPI00406DA0FD
MAVIMSAMWLGLGVRVRASTRVAKSSTLALRPFAPTTPTPTSTIIAAGNIGRSCTRTRSRSRSRRLGIGDSYSESAAAKVNGCRSRSFSSGVAAVTANRRSDSHSHSHSNSNSASATHFVLFAPPNLSSNFYTPSRPKSTMAFSYPETRRDDSIVDIYHDIKIQDPYRWLEDPEADETKKFVDLQNSVTTPYINQCAFKSDINERLTELWNYQKYSCPSKRGDRYFFYKNTGLQNQSVLYVQDSLDGEARIFLDPNVLSEDGTVAISVTAFSEDGNTFAYGLSESGSDWIKIHFKDVNTGKNYPEVLEKIKFSGLSWSKDNKGVFYSRYPEQTGKTDGSETDPNKDHKLYYHFLNTPQSEDVLVVEFPDEPNWRMYFFREAEVSDCGKYLIVGTAKDCRFNLLFFADLSLTPVISGKLKLTQVVFKFEGDFEYITNEGSNCVFRTNKDAPNYRLINIDLSKPEEENWTVLVPEHELNVLDWVGCVNNDRLIIHYIKDVKSVLQIHDLLTGDLIKTLPLDVGTVTGFSGKKKQTEMFYKFVSFLTPGVIYHYDFTKSDEPKIFRQVTVTGFDSSVYESNQVFYSSKDGTKIPMFIVSKKGLKLDGNNPVLLYGYGGFNYSLQPAFGVTRLMFIQHLNGVVAIPNIRGGGEYGKKWHNGGRLQHKQNVFDDFQAAAEYLVANKYSKSNLITIQGASNGGLLVAACINQRPDLFGAAIAQVGVLDMLRFHKFTIGQAWVSDYGCSDNKEEFDALIKYSPLHNVRKLDTPDCIQYPATLVLTADHDDRVVPLHSLKFIAQLQYNARKSTCQKNPLFARIETNAGHGAGKPTAKVIEENTDVLCFMVQSMGLSFVK